MREETKSKMSNFNVMMSQSSRLQRDLGLVRTENDTLREQLTRALNELSELKVEAKKNEEEKADLNSLAQRRKYLESRSLKETKLSRELTASADLNCRFINDGKLALLCVLREIQDWKIRLHEAELAAVVSRAWACKTEDFECEFEQLVHRANKMVDKCDPEKMDPFVVDAINDVLRDC